MKAKRPVAAIGGSASGTAIRRNAWKRVQPSITAASNSSMRHFSEEDREDQHREGQRA